MLQAVIEMANLAAQKGLHGVDQAIKGALLVLGDKAKLLKLEIWQQNGRHHL